MEMALKIIAPAVGLLAGEELYFRSNFAPVYAFSSLVPFLPRAYAGVVLVNIVGSSLGLIVLGGKVGGARKQFIEKAKKDGDADAEARFSYPKLYAEGFSDHAKKFNCIQRGHQHALETYTAFVTLSLIAGVKYPITATVGGLVWLAARFAWAGGYATGEPSRRYENLIAVGVWTSLFIQLAGTIGTIIAFVK
mmetsp:Transcript_15974/g.11529  ORF Transcript_15974/g.11529 Transcript_15974/m.11529 type:complete len:193 (-) Transcript_15974:109-687(-)|eukprot:CAMPEP_0202963534 /NCGR_PEP_ID=MMETSP1396-20130829/7544_1 /ASSEMBLY_ACC=CAM_ASM_000872 /TAXON_ID= /ORGANISM="Pseudokeronopsis sp., Strain Brazil" /LENGTH=192 /DNA_ID=CAMNT_0049684841 /DNA_START=64 /DNA_END=642 /DNA_ORIENTATION=-